MKSLPCRQFSYKQVTLYKQIKLWKAQLQTSHLYAAEISSHLEESSATTSQSQVTNKLSFN